MPQFSSIIIIKAHNLCPQKQLVLYMQILSMQFDMGFVTRKFDFFACKSLQSNLGYPNADYPKLLGYSKTMDSPEFFLYYLLQ